MSNASLLANWEYFRLHSYSQPTEISSASPMRSRSGYNMPRINSRKLRELVCSYAPDWIVNIALGGASIALDAVPGFKREFSLEDTSLYHPYAVHERVPPAALFFICGVAPFLLQLAINFVTVRSWRDAHSSTLGLVQSLAVAGAITQVAKITVGRPRPDLISRCMPLSNVTIPEYQLATASICTQTDRYIMTDGWRSFPSGHSSLSFAGLAFLSFYLAGKLHPFDKRGSAIKAWLTLIPLLAAALVAISRTMDYRHHATDVLTGSILGLVVSYFSYRQYYPSLNEELSHRPCSPRIKPDEILLPIHRDPLGGDDEQARYMDHRTSEDGQELSDGIPPPDDREHITTWKDDVAGTTGLSHDYVSVPA